MALGTLLLAALTAAQAAGAFPTATTPEALATYPGFYHLKQIVVRGAVRTNDSGQAFLSPIGGEGRALQVLVPAGEHAPEGESEVSGQFLDVGRIEPDDPRATARNLRSVVEARLGADRWPAHGELLMIAADRFAPLPPATGTPSLRELSLQPGRYEGEVLTVSGQFGGRNLFGDVAQAPRVDRVEFVLRAAGGAVWGVGVEPKGRGWQLRLDARVDTAQWLEATGRVRSADGIVWLEATKVARTTAAAEEPPERPAAPVLPARPPEVLFSLPLQDDIDVPPATPVRIQVSRDLDEESLPGHVRVTYLGRPEEEIPFKASLERGNRVLQLAFEKPFEPFSTVKVELLEGIKGRDGQPLPPWTLTFSTGR